MFKLAFAALAAAPLVLASPALAADPAQLPCVAQNVDKATRDQLALDLERNMKNAQGEQSYSPIVTQGLMAAAKTCQAKYKWSDKATIASMLYTMPVIGWPTAVRVARGTGVDAAKLEQRFMTLTPDERRTAMDGQDIFRRVATAAFTAGEITEANASMGGAVLGLVAVRERGLADFRDN